MLGVELELRRDAERRCDNVFAFMNNKHECKRYESNRFKNVIV
jgi:hypothetical protein